MSKLRPQRQPRKKREGGPKKEDRKKGKAKAKKE